MNEIFGHRAIFGKITAGLSLLFMAILLSSCASAVHSQKVVQSLDNALASRDIDAALKIVENPKNYKDKERLLYYLDAGMLHHYKGDWERSNELLELAESAIEQLQTKSLSRGAGSMLLNDNTLEYSGEDYEDIYINVFKALNYLNLDERDDAFVEIRRLDDKLGYLEQKHAKMAKELLKDSKAEIKPKDLKSRFHASALARYLSMVMYEADRQKDDARIDYDNIQFAFASQPDLYPFSPPELMHPQAAKSNNVVRVLSFINRGPYKQSREMHVHTSENLLLLGSVDQDLDIAPIAWPGIKEGYYFKFALPYLKERNPRVARVDAVAPNGQRYTLQKLEDINLVAKRSYEAKEAMVLLKSISRTVLKGVAAEQAKSQAQKETSNLGASLLSLAMDAAILISENADLRLSQFFPGAALVAEIPVSAGQNTIRLEYYSAFGSLIYSEEHTLEVGPDQPNFINAWCF
ncbi:MAG: hypothetical protein PHG34_06980 [Candidatus Cloacimonetes bacterium]|jgi:hypothetical protein|nr:hypothetical protein [Candidatus Cloacimonadota bacterium]MDD3562674.1 hypothetical protein [Candidatus Cloacimonadota bacterium]MDY0326340.1 hypothetical protein [Candidatus Cloacimonadaceae bacterium]